MENKNLIKKEYEELFYDSGKETCHDFSVGYGWIPIVRCLCESLLEEKRNIENEIALDELLLKSPILSENEVNEIKNKIKNLKVKIESLTYVKIVQIKEKFGGLRLYTNKILTLEQEIKRNFAYELSFNICEECGKEGKIRKNKWIRTLCDEHNEIHQKR